MITGRGGRRRMFAFGLCAVFFTVISTLPQIILYRKPDPSINAITFVLNLLIDITLVIFIIIVLIRTAAEYEEDTEEEQDNVAGDEIIE